MKPYAARLLVAAGFTLHHTLAIALYLSLPGIILASIGIFVGSLIWSALYARKGGLWLAWIAHIGADLAIFGIAIYMAAQAG